MRITNDFWTVTSGVKIGHDHVIAGINCHDAYAVHAIDPYIFGIICDGCGSGAHSEVGAQLVARYAIGVLQDIRTICTHDIPKILFNHIVSFIRWNLTQFSVFRNSQDEANLVNDYFLCTVLGFLLGPTKTIVFHAGDGVYICNDIITKIESENNAPKYIAYNCVTDKKLISDPSVLADHFETEEFFTESLDRLMIASDGFYTHKEWLYGTNTQTSRVEKQRDVRGELIPLPPIEGQQWGLKGVSGMPRFLNRMSDKGYFTDDVSIITVEKLHPIF